MEVAGVIIKRTGLSRLSTARAGLRVPGTGRAHRRRAGVATVIAAAAAVSLVLAACGGSGAAGTAQKGAHQKVTLTWWTWTANPKSVIKNFEQKYPWITIPAPPSYGSGGTFYSKLTTALAAGNGPCVSQVELDHLPQFTQAKDLVDIAKYDGKYAKDFPAWVWSQVTQGTALYAMPEDIGPMGLMYQPSVLARYHLPTPATWATFASDAVALHKADPSMYLTYFPVNDGDYLEALFWQAGARPYQLLPGGTWKIDVDGPAEQKVLNYWGTLVDEHAVATEDDFEADWGHHIADDMYAAYIGAAWSPTYEVDEYLTSAHPQTYTVAPLPQWTAGAHAEANWGGSTNAVTKDCPADEVQDAALFAAYINTSTSGLAVDEKPATATGGGRGLFPASLARASVPQFSAAVPDFTGQVNAVFAANSGNVPTNFEWSPWDTEFGNYITAQMPAAAAGKESWTKALQVTQQQLVSYAKDAGYPVQG
jgi:multiple sugar transport system substrate-binding protein